MGLGFHTRLRSGEERGVEERRGFVEGALLPGRKEQRWEWSEG